MRHPCLDPFRQRFTVRCGGSAAMDCRRRSPNRLHRAGIALGERLRRELQRASATSSSTGRSCSLSRKPRFPSNPGGAITTPYARTAAWDSPPGQTGRRHGRRRVRNRCLEAQHLPHRSVLGYRPPARRSCRGRPRQCSNALGRPPQAWPCRPRSTNIQTGPPNEDRPRNRDRVRGTVEGRRG